MEENKKSSQPYFPELFDEIDIQCKRKNLDLKDLIDDLDTRSEGFLSKFRFGKMFNFLSIYIKPTTFSDLVECYTIKDTNNIDSARFFADYENSKSNFSETLKRAAILDDELRQFGKRLRIQNTSIEEILGPYDSFHVGHISIEKFLNAFGTNSFTKRLANAYSRMPTNEVFYLNLKRDVEKALTAEIEIKTIAQKVGKELPPYFKEFCHRLREKGVIPFQALSVYDKLKKKSILSCHFMSECANFGVCLTHEQMLELNDLFLNDERKFDYVTFCDAIAEEDKIDVEEKNERQRKEDEEKRLSQKSNHFSRQIGYINDDEKSDINQVLKSIEIVIQDRRGRLGERLEHFDQQKTGKLKIAHFFSILEQEKYDFLRPADKKAIIDEFVDDTEENILYRPFVIAVTPNSRTGPVVTADCVADRLRDFLNEKKVSIRPYLLKLVDRNPQKSGSAHFTPKMVNFRQLLSVFVNISFDINPHEKRALFALTTENVEIDSFCDRVDYIPIDSNDNSKEEFDQKKKNENENEINKILEDEEELPSKEVLNSLARLMSIIENEEIDLMDEFKQFDSRGFLINKSQFHSALIHLPSTKSSAKIPQDDIDLLTSSYFDKGSNKIDTQKLERDLRTYGNDQLKLTPSLSLTLNKTITTSQKIDQKNVINLMKKLKVFVMSKEIPPISLFSLYDTSKNGYVPKDRVPAIFKQISFSDASSDEIGEVLKTFESQKMSDFFNYRRFILELENVEIIDEDLKSVKITHDNPKNPQNYQLVSLTNTLHSKLFERRKNADIVFNGVEKDTISAEEFRSRIQNYGLIIKLSDVQLLLKSYRANLSNEVEWKRFCHDVNSSKTVEPPR